MNFSRRNATQPLPPLPERTYTLAMSRNLMMPTIHGNRRRECWRPQTKLPAPASGLTSMDGVGSRGLPLPVLAAHGHQVAINAVAAREAIAFARAIGPETQLAQHMARGRIVVKPAGLDHIGPQIAEGKGQNLACRLCCVTLLPVWSAEPVADLIALLAQMLASHPHERAITLARDREREVRRFGAPLFQTTDKGVR